MKGVSIADDIIPVGKFKSDLAKYLKEVQGNRNTLVITQHGKPAGVLISPSEYDELKEKMEFIDSISRGLSDSEEGEMLKTSELKAELKRTG